MPTMGRSLRQPKEHLVQVTPSRTLEELRADVTGPVITPDDTEYDSARTVFLGGIDRRPAAIVRVADESDVARVVSIANESGVELAVRSGGHSGAGHGVSEGGIVIDLAAMKSLDIDVERRTAWAQTGLTAGEYTAAAAAHGLATGFGDTGTVGIGGLTLGGGVGYFVRKYGLTIDELLAAEVVTADGQILHVDADTHPDLFWAIRGGGGNFGVATRFQFRLQEVPIIVGGMLMLPATAETVHAFVAAADNAPDELSTIANVMTAPPMPFVPAEYHGKPVIMGMLCYAGDTDEGERVLAKFRALAEPIVDMVKPMPYPGMYPPEDPEYRPIAATKTMFVDDVDEDAAATIVERLAASTAMLSAVQIRPLGGAMARVPNDATAFAHRHRKFMVNVAALCQRVEDRPPLQQWVDGVAAELQRGDVAAYVNFLTAEGEGRVRQAYPEATWERLAAVKRRYDPTNLFRLNQNVPPSN
jgi:FAD/FMN-containing dehydrogenase